MGSTLEKGTKSTDGEVRGKEASVSIPANSHTPTIAAAATAAGAAAGAPALTESSLEQKSTRAPLHTQQDTDAGADSDGSWPGLPVAAEDDAAAVVRLLMRLPWGEEGEGERESDAATTSLAVSVKEGLHEERHRGRDLQCCGCREESAGEGQVTVRPGVRETGSGSAAVDVAGHREGSSGAGVAAVLPSWQGSRRGRGKCRAGEASLSVERVGVVSGLGAELEGVRAGGSMDGLLAALAHGCCPGCGAQLCSRHLGGGGGGGALEVGAVRDMSRGLQGSPASWSYSEACERMMDELAEEVSRGVGRQVHRGHRRAPSRGVSTTWSC